MFKLTVFISLFCCFLCSEIKSQTFTEPIKTPPALTKFFNIGTTNGKYIVITETGLSGPKFLGLKALTNDESISFNNLMLKSSVYNLESNKKEEYFDLGFPKDKVYVLTSYFSESAFNILAYYRSKEGIQLNEYSIDPTNKKSKWNTRTLYTSTYKSSQWISSSKILIRDNTIIMITPAYETLEVLKIKQNGKSDKKTYDIGFATELESISYEKESILGTFRISDRTYVFSLDEDNTHKTALLFKGDSIKINYSINKVEDEVVISGTYSAFKEGQQGLYYNKLNTSTFGSKIERFFPIDSTYNNKLAKQDYRENKILRNFYFDKTMIDNQGNAYVFSSQQYKDVVATTGTLGYGTNAQVYYYSTDILVGKIDIEGNLKYQSIVPRSLKSLSYDEIGYYSMIKDNSVQILTCDHEDNKNLVGWEAAAENTNGTNKTNIALISIDDEGIAKRDKHFVPAKGNFYRFNSPYLSEDKISFLTYGTLKFHFFEFKK